MRHLARWLSPALAALCALALTACTTVHLPAAASPASVDDARMGAVVQPTAHTRQGSSASKTLLDAVVATASVDSSEVDCSGFTEAWVELEFAGMAAGTNLVGGVQVLGGNRPLIADQQALPFTSTGTVPYSTDWPVGLTLDTTSDYGIDIADTFETDTTIALPMGNKPRYLSVRFTRSSGGTGATVSATVYCQ